MFLNSTEKLHRLISPRSMTYFFFGLKFLIVFSHLLQLNHELFFIKNLIFFSSKFSSREISYEINLVCFSALKETKYSF